MQVTVEQPLSEVQGADAHRGAAGGDISATELRELRAGLLQPLPELAARYFYDPTGVSYYDLLVDLPEYYPSRTELGILKANAADIIAHVGPSRIVELGSGIGEKIGTLLDAMVAEGGPAEHGGRCTMFDIAEAWLPTAVATLGERYPMLEIDGVHGDFNQHLDRLGPGGDRLIVFFAGTLGNLHPDRVPSFLAAVRRQMEPGDCLLVGVDLVKDPAIIEAAYNDSAGVTAAFNCNILAALNRRFRASFDVDAFEHRAFFDTHPDHRWLEMRLRAVRPTTARIAGLRLDFGEGDELRTELSTKYTPERLAERAQLAGLVVDRWYSDPKGWFGVALLRPSA